MVGWAVLTHDLSPRFRSPMGPPAEGPGWSLVIYDAATGAPRSGLSSGLGPEPPFWASINDLAP